MKGRYPRSPIRDHRKLKKKKLNKRWIKHFSLIKEKEEEFIILAGRARRYWEHFWWWLYPLCLPCFDHLWQALQGLLNIFDRLYKVFWKPCKNLCNFFIEMNKLKTFSDFASHWIWILVPLPLTQWHQITGGR